MIDQKSASSLLTKENIKDIYPLSAMQEGILFHSLLDEHSASYFQQKSYRMHGHLNADNVRRAIDELVARHDVLRTVFKYTGVEIPLQIVLKQWRADFVYEDLRAVEQSDAREARVREFKEKDRARLFNLSKGPLMRVALLQLGDDEYELIWSWHHILMDGWCLGILQGEFLELYHSDVDHRPHRLQPPKAFSLYIKWLEGRDKEAARQFWQSYLTGYDEATSFPTRGGAFLQQRGYQHQKVVFSLSSEKTARLRSLANSRHITLAHLLQAIWGVLLAKYTGTRDVVFGLVTSGRPVTIDGIENMIGLFINTIPVRVRFGAEGSFDDLLQEVKQGALACEEYSYYPLNELQALSETRGGLFDHILVFNQPDQPPQDSDPQSERATVSGVDVFEQTNYDLCVDFSLGDSIHISLTFNGYVHDRRFIERTANAFATLTDQALANPARLLKQMSLMTAADLSLLNRFNATDKDFPRHRSIVEIIEGFAASTPRATAVACKDKVVTYAELNERANQIAHLICSRAEILPDDRVVILMERSEVMVESILAAWKSGAAYVPIEVDYPASRILTMVADCNAKLVLTEGSAVGADLLSELSTLAEVVPLDQLEQRIAQCQKSNLDRALDQRSLAYTIYTSGSTGKPKGAMIEHVGMLNHLYAKIDELHLNAESVVVQNSSHCFDISVWQFFAALIVGGTTVIYGKDLVLHPESLMQRLAADRATVLELVPSYLAMLLGTSDEATIKRTFKTLRYLLVTGEALKANLIRRWFELFEGIPLVNAYGPTEASDDITHEIITRAPSDEIVPIGRPLQNLKIYIADDDLNLCPIGIKGEILVSGIGVGRGYLNDPERTAQAFIEDPFRPERGVRMYKTGDIGRYSEDGRIEFFGRKDNQVKVHGFRIELEEIEHTIALHPSVKEAVVVDKKNASGDTFLIGYLIVNDPFDLDALRRFLAERLPDYMVPSRFSVLEVLPLTNNGKLDRNAFREMPAGEEAQNSSNVYLAPRGELETKLVELWQEVLKVERVGVLDDFFDLGGDSFKAIRVVSKFGKGFLVPDLYKYPTVEKLACFIEQNGQGRSSLLYRVSADTDVQKYAIVAIPNSAGDPIIYQETADALMGLSREYPLYGVALPRREPGPDETLQSVMELLVAEIVKEIKQKIQVPVILFGQCNGAGLALQLARRLQEENVECKAICMSAQLPRMKITPAEDLRTDEELLQFLEKLGGTYPASLEDQIMFIRNFRYDGAMAKTAYNGCLESMKKKEFKKLNPPLYCIVGDKDILTKNYKSRYKDWKNYAEVVELVVMKDVGHYMWRDKPADLARILFDIAEGRIAAEAGARADGPLSRLKTLLTSR